MFQVCLVASLHESTKWVDGDEMVPSRVFSGGITSPKKLIRLLALEKKDIYTTILYACALGVLSLAVPLAVQAIVGFAAMGSFVQPIIVISLALGLALSANLVLRVFQVRVVEMLQRRLFLRVVVALGEKIPRIRHSAWIKRHPSEHFNRFFDVFTIKKAAVSFFVDGIDALVVFVVGIFVLALYHPFLLAFDLVFVTLFLFTLWLSGRNGAATAVGESSAKYAIADWFQGNAIRSVSDRFPPRIRHDQTDLLHALENFFQKRESHFAVVLRQFATTWGLQAFAILTLLVLGAWLVTQEQLSIGQLVAAELIVTAIANSIRKMANKLEVYYDAVAAAEKLGSLFLLEEDPDRSDFPSPQIETTARFAVIAEDLLLDDHDLMTCSLHAARGSKSFLLLDENTPPSLGRFLSLVDEPSAGRLEIYGNDYREVSTHGLREGIYYIARPTLRIGTVRDNLLASSERQLSTDDLWSALEKVSLREFFRSRETGLDTPLGFLDGELSTDVRIRIEVAKAILSKADLLIVDQALGQLSRRSSHELLGVLETLPKTIIVCEPEHFGDDWPELELVMHNVLPEKGVLNV